jgi:hypothetical protein
MQWVRVSKALEAEAMEFGNGNGNECEPQLVAGTRTHVQVNGFGCGGLA